MPDGRIYMLQPSFATGEISPDVASRVDLDKYRSALLQAENVFIRPYGSAYRRPGTEYCAEISDGSVFIRLQEFTVDANTSYLLLFTPGKLKIYKDGNLITTKNTPFIGYNLKKLRFAQSADVMFIASGTFPVQVLKRTGTDTFSNLSAFVPKPGYIDATTMVDGTTITPSATSGSNKTLTASTAIFKDDAGNTQAGNYVELSQQVAAQNVTLELDHSETPPVDSGKSNGIKAGPEGWKVITHGTWTGNVKIEYCKTNSNNDSDWQTLREYTSSDDYNVTESGTFDENTWVRVNGTITSGEMRADLTAFPYTNRGKAVINSVDSTGKIATVNITEEFANTNACDDWAFGSWSAVYGYPSCVTFFQDRLCFAANDRQPYMVWMSRTGDYYNFGTERVDGTLTDDSAVAVSFITRKDYRILHLMAHADLLVMTEGNEWIINGAEVVTPTNVSPRLQTSRGSTEVVPEMIGGQMIYVQRHGKTVRDLQYNFGTDSYDGMDLTILAKHITQDKTIVDSAYRQEPDYMMFYVLDDGTCACLTYVKEQQVFAWCRMKTKGTIYAVETISTPYYDDVYFVVYRTNGWFLEKLSNYPHYEYPHDYIMMDCAVHGEDITPPIDDVTVSIYANQDIEVLADGRRIPGIKADANGNFKLDVPASNLCMGLKYTSVWELPNIEMQLQDGTLQGRRKKVSEVILRLDNSLGGRVGMATDKTDIIKYDELQKEEVTLYSGEKIVTVPNVSIGGFNDKGRVVVTSDDPYPLSISSIVRAVVPGG